jgi:tetratricopeptide (TPR) repeat protein
MLHFELARSRFARGDEDGARRSLKDLGATTAGGWLARALEAFLPATDENALGRAREALDELASRPQPDDVARGLVLMAALRAQRAGDMVGARNRLRDLFAKKRDDTLVATYLAELERSQGAFDEVARIAEGCAAAIDDTELAAALRIEAGLARWRIGERPQAIRSFEAAIAAAPEAARAVLAWAMRGVDAGSPEMRRRAITRALEAGGDEASLMLERFATELAAGDVAAASAALVAVESASEPALASPRRWRAPRGRSRTTIPRRSTTPSASSRPRGTRRGRWPQPRGTGARAASSTSAETRRRSSSTPRARGSTTAAASPQGSSGSRRR